VCSSDLPEFTGISSPYESPEDADLALDTTGVSVEEALAQILPRVSATAVPEAAASTPPSPDRLKVLFVCTANICRSPYMELLARQLAGDRLDIDSAGTMGFDAAPMDADMVGALPEGLDPSAFRSKAVTKALIDGADLVLTAESSHRTYLLDDHPAAFRKVLTLGQAAAAISRLEGADSLSGKEIVAQLASRRGNAGADTDIADPYRRGPEAARVCAERITALLRTVIPALAR
jgi:sulfate adenylyltransferase